MTEVIQTQGIIVQSKPYGETSSIIDVFTLGSGLLKGYVKGARSKKNAGIYQKGNLIDLIHSRRLAEQLGTIQADLRECLWQEFSRSRLNFKIFNILCDLKPIILASNVYEPVIYQSFIGLTELLLQSPDKNTIVRAYVDYLYIVLEQIGYAPDFSRCGVTGTQDDLIYVSPKTVRTICHSVGLAYHDRLLLLPEFFKNHALSASIDDINNGQKIMQLCYNKFIFHPRNIELSLMLE
jgi:DNA repair protein RecO (recombination protein O)